MPWVKKEMCTGCGTCVEECPAGAMSLADGVASIDDAECIRCGKCHDVCPEEAVRHDCAQIPQNVEDNLAWATTLMGKFGTDEEKDALLDRLKRYFNKQVKVAQKTIERLPSLRGRDAG